MGQVHHEIRMRKISIYITISLIITYTLYNTPEFIYPISNTNTSQVINSGTCGGAYKMITTADECWDKALSIFGKSSIGFYTKSWPLHNNVPTGCSIVVSRNYLPWQTWITGWTMYNPKHENHLMNGNPCTSDRNCICAL